MPTVKILIQIPQELQDYLNLLRREGYTASGYIRGLLERDLRAREAAGWSAANGWPQVSKSEFEQSVEAFKKQEARRQPRRPVKKGR